MVAWQPHILVHIKRHHVPESIVAPSVRYSLLLISLDTRELAIFDEADEVFVCRDRRRACGQTEHEWLLRRRPEVVDPEVRRVRTGLCVSVAEMAPR